MAKKKGLLERISSHANWEVPRHVDMNDLEFDPHPSLTYAFVPTWGDPLIFMLSLLQIFAYGYFAFSVAELHNLICHGVLYSLVALFPAAFSIQVCWAVKAAYILDKSSNRQPTFFSFCWRVIRTSALTLPFSYAPAWVIGCLAWPFIRIDVHGGSNFYDQSIMIGQYVQNSLWYVGGRNGTLSENVSEYGEMTILHRSRYWDAAGEQATANVGILVVVVIASYALNYIFGDNASADFFGKYHLSGIHAMVFWGALAIGVLSMIVNTTGLAAVSILEFSKIEDVVVEEPDLPPDIKKTWMLYVPHAIVGAVLYAAFFYFVFITPRQFFCKSIPL